MSPSRRKKKGFFRRNIKAIVFVLIVAAVAAYYVLEADHQEAVDNQAHQIASPYHMLENQDSLEFLVNISLNQSRSVLQISKDFYKSEDFWPYILLGNPGLTEEDNILNINTGVIIKIPKVASSLIDTSNVNNMRHVKYLGDSLMADIAQKRKDALNSQSFTEW